MRVDVSAKIISFPQVCACCLGHADNASVGKVPPRALTSAELAMCERFEAALGKRSANAVAKAFFVAMPRLSRGMPPAPSSDRESALGRLTQWGA